MVLYAPNGSVVRAKHPRPEPNGEVEERVRKELKNLDSLLDIRWFPYAVFNQKYNGFEGRYALVCQWPMGDGRWELYQKGEIEDNVDMLGWFCTDLHDAESVPVSPDSILNKVLELLGKCDDNRISHAKRMKQVMEKNAKLRESRKNDMLDRAGQIARDLHYMSGHVEDVKLQRIMKEIADEA